FLSVTEPSLLGDGGDLEIRVFISDDFDGELFPRGVVDSDDLPLNVSR
uniref:Putative heat shock protein HSP90 (Fragments) n=1 Tax=Populus euphratica TaxID=75702 RepID=HSP90_POPEU|nr:RecName: Full=Putative heat shock protein HSP90 [Populus euphratica]